MRLRIVERERARGLFRGGRGNWEGDRREKGGRCALARYWCFEALPLIHISRARYPFIANSIAVRYYSITIKT